MLSRRGTASIEFALVGTALFMLLIGTLDVGRVFFIQQCLRDALAEAARQAVVDATLSGCSSAKAKIVGAVPLLAPDSLTLCVTRTTTAAKTTLAVSASYPFVSVMSLFLAPANRLTESTTVVFNNP